MSCRILPGATVGYCTTSGCGSDSDCPAGFDCKDVELQSFLSVSDIGGGRGAQAAPDGYTLLVNSSIHVIVPSLFSKVPYNALEDLVAVLVEVLTDNKNRAAANVRNLFSKNGGNLGATGSVSYMFNRKGVVIVPQDVFVYPDRKRVFYRVQVGDIGWPSASKIRPVSGSEPSSGLQTVTSGWWPRYCGASSTRRSARDSFSRPSTQSTACCTSADS